MSQPTDSEVLAALRDGGVDSWDWYGESLSALTEEQMKDDSLVLNALFAGGVDNWDWYGESVSHLYTDEDEDDEDEPVEPEPATETSVEDIPMPLSEQRLRAHLGDAYDEVGKEFWKRSYRPKEFDKAMKTVKAGRTMEEARLTYLDLLIGKGL